MNDVAEPKKRRRIGDTLKEAGFNNSSRGATVDDVSNKADVSRLSIIDTLIYAVDTYSDRIKNSDKSKESVSKINAQLSADVTNYQSVMPLFSPALSEYVSSSINRYVSSFYKEGTKVFTQEEALARSDKKMASIRNNLEFIKVDSLLNDILATNSSESQLKLVKTLKDMDGKSKVSAVRSLVSSHSQIPSKEDTTTVSAEKHSLNKIKFALAAINGSKLVSKEALSMDDRVSIRKKQDTEADKSFWINLSKNKEVMLSIREDMEAMGYSKEVIDRVAESLKKDGNPNPRFEDKSIELPVLMVKESSENLTKMAYVKNGNAGNLVNTNVKGYEIVSGKGDSYISNDLKSFSAEVEKGNEMGRTILGKNKEK